MTELRDKILKVLLELVSEGKLTEMEAGDYATKLTEMMIYEYVLIDKETGFYG